MRTLVWLGVPFVWPHSRFLFNYLNILDPKSSLSHYFITNFQKQTIFNGFKGPGAPGDLANRWGIQKYLDCLIFGFFRPRRGRFIPIFRSNIKSLLIRSGGYLGKLGPKGPQGNPGDPATRSTQKHPGASV